MVKEQENLKKHEGKLCGHNRDEEEDYDNESQAYMIRKLLLTLRVTKDLQ